MMQKVKCFIGEYKKLYETTKWRKGGNDIGRKKWQKRDERRRRKRG
jgi:hypothetical protein